MERNNGTLWFYTIGIAFAAGILVRSFWQFTLAEIALLIVVGLAVAVAGRGRAKGPPAPGHIFFTLAIFAFALGLLRMDFAERHSTDPYLERRVDTPISLAGIVKREPEARGTTTHLYVQTEHGVLLVTTDAGEEWRYGDRVAVAGTLSKPESFETDLGRTFDYPGYLRARGVSYMIRYAEVADEGSGAGNALFSRIFAFKRRFMAAIEAELPEPAAGLGEGLLLGVQQSLGDRLEDTFRRTGIVHMVVLSGYNVMIVVAFVLYVLGRLFGRRLSTLFGFAAIAAFAIMVGLGATVIRASIMAALLLLLGLTGRVYFVLRGLVLAGVVMLLYNPYSLAFDVGFQLSFLATLGLIAVSPYLADRLALVPAFAGAREFLVATLATQIFVSPFLLYQIGQFSVVAVIVNVLVLPMVPTAMLLTFLSGVAGWLAGPLAWPISYAAYLSLMYIIKVAEWFGDLPFAAFTVPAFPFYFVPLGYAAMALIFWQQSRGPDLLKGWRIIEETPSS